MTWSSSCTKGVRRINFQSPGCASGDVCVSRRRPACIAARAEHVFVVLQHKPHGGFHFCDPAGEAHNYENNNFDLFSGTMYKHTHAALDSEPLIRAVKLCCALTRRHLLREHSRNRSGRRTHSLYSAYFTYIDHCTCPNPGKNCLF